MTIHLGERTEKDIVFFHPLLFGSLAEKTSRNLPENIVPWTRDRG